MIRTEADGLAGGAVASRSVEAVVGLVLVERPIVVVDRIGGVGIEGGD